jgi:hypothetical protein
LWRGLQFNHNGSHLRKRCREKFDFAFIYRL